MLGFPPPAVRSAVMVCTVAVTSNAFQRHTSRWAVLGSAGSCRSLNPSTALDLGYQLSVAGMAALIAGGALVKRLRLARDLVSVASRRRIVDFDRRDVRDRADRRRFVRPAEPHCAANESRRRSDPRARAADPLSRARCWADGPGSRGTSRSRRIRLLVAFDATALCTRPAIPFAAIAVRDDARRRRSRMPSLRRPGSPRASASSCTPGHSRGSPRPRPDLDCLSRVPCGTNV